MPNLRSSFSCSVLCLCFSHLREALGCISTGRGSTDVASEVLYEAAHNYFYFNAEFKKRHPFIVLIKKSVAAAYGRQYTRQRQTAT